MQQRACVTDGADEVSRVDAQRAVPQLLAQVALEVVAPTRTRGGIEAAALLPAADPFPYPIAYSSL